MSTSRNKKAAFTESSRRGTVAVNKTVSSRKGGPASIESQGRARKSVYGNTSRTVLSSSSRRNVGPGASDKLSAPSRPPVQVIDEDGQDVTPVPLLSVDPNAVRQKQSNLLSDSAAGTPTDLMSQASIYQTGTVNASTFGGGPFTRSVFSASQSGRSTGSIADDLGEPAPDMSTPWTESKVEYKREEVKEVLAEADLDRVVTMTLTETPTIWLIDQPAICVSAEADDALTIKQRNDKYHELCKSRAGNDRYMERAMNTFNHAPKLKHTQTAKIEHNSVGVNASNWDMYDTYAAQEQAADSDEEAESRPSSAGSPSHEAAREEAKAAISREATSTSITKPSIESLSSTLGTDHASSTKNAKLPGGIEEEEPDYSATLESEELKRDLVTMERAINLNTYQSKQAQYRGFIIYPDPDAEIPAEAVSASKKVVTTTALTEPDLTATLDHLWAYQCPLTKGRNVSCIAWNKVNPDLLAVGYGQFEYSKQKGGLVCCWSLKNPEFPERVFTTDAGLTALDFSTTHPNLLAAGLYNGTVAIFNASCRDNETVLDSFDSTGKHTGPVWQLKWVEKERGSGEERTEVLVSISTDGRVTQWSIRKGFESYDLMKLKRTNVKTQQGKTKKAEAFISRFAGGMCFDFSQKDTNIYIAGTEEGHIHRCSCSYNEQYLDSYRGHNGPVYGIQWSPFAPDVFLSCSGDWSIKLWQQDRTAPILTFHSSTKSVPSVCWSPVSSTVFACCNEGAVEIWDLSQSTLDPIVVNRMDLVKLSCVTFSRNSDCLLIGCSDGQVIVVQLNNMPAPQDDKGEALQKIIQSSLASQLDNK